MRAIGTELNMLKRLGFKADPRNLIERNGLKAESAIKKCEKQGVSHVLYAAIYRGRNCRNKTELYVELQPNCMEVFKDDATFDARANELYSLGCTWIGAIHS